MWFNTKKRIMEWSVREESSGTVAYTAVTRKVFLTALFTRGTVTLDFYYTPTIGKALALYDRPGEADRSKKVKSSLLLRVFVDVPEVKVGTKDRKSKNARLRTVRAHCLVADEVLNRVIYGVGQWFETVSRKSGTKAAHSFAPVKITADAAAVKAILSAGYSDLLHDDSVGCVAGALGLLSALGASGMDEENTGAESETNARHLSAAMMKTILSSTDLDRLAAMNEGFVRGLRLFAPEAGASSFGLNHIASGGYIAVDDSVYRFISALYCASQGVAVSQKNDWVPDDVAAVSSDSKKSGGISMIYGWSSRKSGLPDLSPATLHRLNRLSVGQAEYMVSALNDLLLASHRDGEYTTDESNRAAKVLVLDLLLDMIEQGAHLSGSTMGEAIRSVPWLDRIESMTGLRSNDARHAEISEAVEEALYPSTTGLYMSIGALNALLSVKSSPQALTEVLRHWAEVFSSGGDYIVPTLAGLTYLDEFSSDEDPVPFTWWMNLSLASVA